MRTFLWFFLALGFGSATALADPPEGEVPEQEPQFHAIGAARPFRPEIITEVKVDRAGFLWIGTREGLYLHDGQRFRHFQHEVQNPDSLSSNGIRGLLEDSRGRLWINTISGGLNELDRASWTFRSWKHAHDDPESIVHDGVFALAEAPDGRLWVGTQAGLDLFDPDSGRFRRTVLATGGEFVVALRNDREGNLWVGTLGQGLFRQRDDGSGFDPILPAVGQATLDVFSLAQDAQGTLWAGTRVGLYRVAADGWRLERPELAPAELAEALDSVTDLLPAPDGSLWIGTFGAGLFRWIPQEASLRRVRLGPDGPGALHIDGGAMAFGRNGTFFVGTFGAGMFRSCRHLSGLRVWSEASRQPGGHSNQDVYALALDGEPEAEPATLLAGSFGGGIDEIALPEGRIGHAGLPAGAPEGVENDGITALLRARDGSIWATTSEGAFRWNHAAGELRVYRNAQGEDAVPGYSYALLQDRDGRIWIGSGGGGLYLHLAREDGFRRFLPDRADPQSLPDDFVTLMLQDRAGRLWLGTRSGGLGVCRFDQTLRCAHLSAGVGPDRIGHDHVTSLLEDKDGSVWVGTAGGGVSRVRWDEPRAQASIRRWTREEGLEDDNVMALVFAPDGALWMSTRAGLSRLQADTGEILNLSPSDGLPTSVFNPKAALRHRGLLYFGSSKGVVALDPSRVQAAGPAPPTVIAAITGADRRPLAAQPAWEVDALSIPWGTPLTLELAVLGYDGAAPRFQYRLASADAWTELGDGGQLTLHALSPGRHRLEARGRLGGSPWTRTAPIALEIVPPWWRRTDVQAGLGLLLFGALLGGFLLRMRGLQRRHGELRRAHDLRQAALAAARESQARLEDALSISRRLTVRLQDAKEEERRHLARELHDELGQVLTSAKIQLGLALAGTAPGEAAGRVRDAIGLIDRLIAQVRALSLDLRPPLLDELGLGPALEGYLHGVAARSGLEVQVRIEANLAALALERQIALFRIVQEAVTNALRHAQARRLEVALLPQGDAVSVCVRDDGAGFDVERQSREGSPGLGLFGMRERVHDLGGRWSVASVPGGGTCVTATVPITHPAEQ